MEKEIRRIQIDGLTSPLFLCSLGILLLNDFVLKAQFHNELTGKISDISGLIVFVLFWSSVVPRLKLQIHIFVGLSFLIWKSPYAEPLITWWNELNLFSLARTVDYTDMLALCVLPITYCFRFKSVVVFKKQWTVSLISIITVFAFTATSYSKKTAYQNEYYFSESKKGLIQRMSRLPQDDVFEWFSESDEFVVVFDSCISQATITVSENAGSGIIKLTEIDFRCPSPPGEGEMREYFESEFIEKLKVSSSEKEMKIKYIWATRPEGYVNSNQNRIDPKNGMVSNKKGR